MQWEYYSMRADWGDFDELGKDGWELVAVTSENADYGPQAYFKRPIKAAEEAEKDDI